MGNEINRYLLQYNIMNSIIGSNTDFGCIQTMNLGPTNTNR